MLKTWCLSQKLFKSDFQSAAKNLQIFGAFEKLCLSFQSKIWMCGVFELLESYFSILNWNKESRNSLKNTWFSYKDLSFSVPERIAAHRSSHTRSQYCIFRVVDAFRWDVDELLLLKYIFWKLGRVLKQVQSEKSGASFRNTQEKRYFEAFSQVAHIKYNDFMQERSLIAGAMIIR